MFAVVNKPLGTLIADHKKDVFLSNTLPKHKKNVAIYDWYNKDGTVIQNLNPSSHSVNYGKKMSEEQKLKMRESKAKKHYGDATFIFTHVENIRIEVKAINLTEFMKMNGLERSGFYDLLAGRLKTHKRWKVIRVDNPPTSL